MDTTVLNSILRKDHYVKPIFGGTWSVDCFPKNNSLPVCNIINTSPSWHPGTHWVAVFRGENADEYFCSYGTEAPSEIRRNLRKNFVSSHFVLQSPTSDLCGHYCILYLLCKCRGISLRNFLSCFTSVGSLNDQLVSKVFGNYISRL